MENNSNFNQTPPEQSTTQPENRFESITASVRGKPLPFLVAALMAAATVIVVALCFFTNIGGSCYCISSRELDLSSRGLTSTEGLEIMTDLELLDLRGNNIPTAEIAKLSRYLPGCEILCDITIEGRVYESTVSDITLTGMTEEDLALLPLFTRLETIDARGMSVETVEKIMQMHPDSQITWDISIGGTRYLPDGTTTLTLGEGTTAEEVRNLVYFTSLESVDARGCTEYESLMEVSSKLENCDIVWSVNIGGIEFDNDTEIMNFKRRKIDSPGALEQDFKNLCYLPALKQIDMCGCGVSNEQMAQWRDAYPQYKFVWEITFGSQFTNWTVRTDIKVFSTLLGSGAAFGDEETFRDLFLYCTDLVALDLGHNRISDISLIANLKKLQGIILTDNPVEDISPLGELPELVFAELNMTGVTDISPLKNCKKLRHLDVYYTKVADLSPLYDCDNLETLVLVSTNVPVADRKELKEALPECSIIFAFDEKGTELRNNPVRGEFRLALCNWSVVEEFTDYQNKKFKDGATLTIPRGYIKP